MIVFEFELAKKTLLLNLCMELTFSVATWIYMVSQNTLDTLASYSVFKYFCPISANFDVNPKVNFENSLGNKVLIRTPTTFIYLSFKDNLIAEGTFYEVDTLLDLSGK